MLVVLTKAEVQNILVHLSGEPKLIAQLLYGSGLRLNEALRLRVKDLDFEQHQITIRDGKGAQCHLGGVGLRGGQPRPDGGGRARRGQRLKQMLSVLGAGSKNEVQRLRDEASRVGLRFALLALEKALGD